jgi:hypothetical protein
MIPMMGLTICFYIAMRGFDWFIMSREARLPSTFYARVVLGAVTVLGAMIFGFYWVSSGGDAPSYPTGV